MPENGEGVAQDGSAITQGGTGNPYIDGVLSGNRWTGSLTFSFPQVASQYPSSYAEGEPSTNFAPISVQQQNAVRAILVGATAGNVLTYNSVSDFTNLNVSESHGLGNGTDGSGDLRFGQSTRPSTAYAYYPSNSADGSGGDIWFGTAYAGTSNDYRDPVLGNYAYQTMVHELGHTLGLKHSQEAGGPSNIAVPSDRDDIEFTTMSYRSYIGAPTTGYTYEPFGAPQSYMMLDIQALQTMYGADYGAHAGNTTYRWDPDTGQMFLREGDGGAFVGQGVPGANRVFLTTWDGGGTDTYDMSNYATAVSIDLRPGQWSVTSAAQRANLGNGHYAQGNVYNAYLFNNNPASLIENAIGTSSNDTLIGNQANNVLTGGLGSDTLTGGDGADSFRGTAVDLNGDTVTDLSNADVINVGDASGPLYGLAYANGAVSFRLSATASQIYSVALSGGTFSGSVSQRIDANGGVDIFFGAAAPSVALSAGSDTGASNSDGVTRLTSLVLNGSGTAGSTVKIFDDANNNGQQDANESILATSALTGGATSYTGTVQLTQGTHYLRAYQTSAQGVDSIVSGTSVVTVDTTAPALTVSSQSLSGTHVTLSGSVEAVATIAVEIFDGTLDIGAASVSNGGWSYTGVLAVGTHPLRVVATDLAGNATTSPVQSVTVPDVHHGYAGNDTFTFGFRLVDARIGTDAVGNAVVDGPTGTQDVFSGYNHFVFTDGTVNQHAGSSLVDDLFYYGQNHDVWNAHVDATAHYDANGWHEGRDPDAFFSTTGYLAANPDVRAAGVNPLAHYDSNGWHEGRDPSASFDNELYLARNPDVRAAGIDPLAHYLANGQAEGRQAYAAIGRGTDIAAAHGFDAEYYLLHNPDVARAAINAGGDAFAFAYQHYETNGWHEGRNPNAVFDVAGYLNAYGDVRAANIDPLAHYDGNGWHEGRDPSASFDTRAYEAHYGDVAAAGIDPLQHYLTNGIYEGRSAYGDGHFG